MRRYAQIIIVVIFVISSMFSGCAHYHAVMIKQAKIEEGASVHIERWYAITKNNIVIPEFVLDSRMQYPKTEEEAWRLFRERRATVGPVIDRKYKIPASFPYQISRVSAMVGLTVVSPVVIPIMVVSSVFGKKENRESVGVIIHDYFDVAEQSPTFQEPLLKNEFEIANDFH